MDKQDSQYELSEEEQRLETAQAEIKDSRERGNNERLDARNRLADQIDEQLAEEFDTELVAAEAEVQNDDDAEGLDPDETEVKEQKTSLPKIKVNGVEVELTQELIAKAQKIASADKYLEDAKNTARPSQRDVERNPAIRKDVGSRVEEIDYAEVATALQTGTTEEVTNALKKLAPQQTLSNQDVFEKAREAVKFEEATTWFREEYEDLTSDPYLRALMEQEDNRLMADGFNGSFKERFKTVGDKVREWKQSIAGTPESKEESTLSKKDKLSARIPTASKKVVKQDQDEGEDDPRELIAAMAKKRRGY